MSSSERDSTKQDRASKASEAKNPLERAKELLEQAKGDKKTAALTMQSEGFSVSEIEGAFKQATGAGIGGRVWAQWKQEDEATKKAGEEAGPILAKAEKAWDSEVLARFHSVTKEVQLHIIELGTYVFETVAPQVPTVRPEDKIRNTKEWLAKAVMSFQPDKIEEIEEFAATAFLAACKVKMQISQFMDWAEPSRRLQEIAEKALYSTNPINVDAFNLLLQELMRTIHEVPSFSGKPTVEELPIIAKAYADARGITLEEAETRLKNLPVLAELE